MQALLLVGVAFLLMGKSSGGSTAGGSAPQQVAAPPPPDKTGQIVADVSAVVKAGLDLYRSFLNEGE